MNSIKQKIIWIILLCLCLTPLLWFIGRGNILIDGVDTNFPLDPIVWAERRLSVWQNNLNAGSDFSSSTAGLFFHFVQVVTFALGLNIHWVEIVSLVFWFSLIVLGSYFFSAIILPKRRIPQLVLVIFYTFNIYLFNTWENVKVANLAVLSAIPISLGILQLIREGKITKRESFLYIFIVGLIASGGGINPAYFLCFFIILTIFLISDVLVEFKKVYLLQRIKEFSIFVIIIICANLFWVLPSANYIFGTIPTNQSLSKIGFTNWTDSLSENTSLKNVMRLQGAWDWYAVESKTNTPLYIPYSINFLTSPYFIGFSFLVILLLMLSLAFQVPEKKQLYLFSGLLFIFGVFLGAGTHEPTGQVYKLLIRHLPFFSLFRSPWYIFTPMITLSVSILLGLLFYRLEIEWESKKFNLSKNFYFAFAFIIILSNFVYSYPLIQGKIFRPGRDDSFFVNFPDYIFQTKDWLREDKNRERIISYPADEIENFKWGYRGVESILSLFSSQQLLFMPLNEPDSPVALLMKEFHLAFRKGEYESSNIIARKLGATLIFNKTDQFSLANEFPAALASDLVKKIGPWEFYKFPNNKNSNQIFSSSRSVIAYPPVSLPQAVYFSDGGEILINSDDSLIRDIKDLSRESAKIVIGKNSQINELKNYQNSEGSTSNLKEKNVKSVDFDFDIPESGSYEPNLERYKLEEFGIDPKGDLMIDLNGNITQLKFLTANDSVVKYQAVYLNQGANVISIKLQNPDLIKDFFRETAANYKKDGDIEVGINQESGVRFLDIRNISGKDGSLIFNMEDFDPQQLYLVQLRYRNLFGDYSQIVIKQDKKEGPLKQTVAQLPSLNDWSDFSYYYEPVASNSDINFEVNLPFTERNPYGARIFVSNFEVYKLFSNKFSLIEKNDINMLGEPALVSEEDSKTNHKILVKGNGASHIIILPENYSDFWTASMYDEAGKLLINKPLHFSANVYANAWFIEDPPKNYILKISYFPQVLFTYGLMITLISGLLSVIIFIGYKLKRK